jgi:hypothetical protein
MAQRTVLQRDALAWLSVYSKLQSSHNLSVPRWKQSTLGSILFPFSRGEYTIVYSRPNTSSACPEAMTTYCLPPAS